MNIFQATIYSPQYAHEDFESVEHAIAKVEAAGSGSIVKFFGSPNMPGRLPKIVYRSCAKWIFEGNEWSSIAIHDGIGGRVSRELPH